MRRFRAWRRYGSLFFLTLLSLVLGACNGAATPSAAPAAPIVPTATVVSTAQSLARTPTAPAAPTTARTIANPSATMAVMTRANVPTKVYDTLRYIQTHNGDPPPGYVGGTIFDNRERRLPEGRYKEYDVDPKMAGVGRNAERLVINQDTNQAYYTADHYVTFILVS